MRCQSYRPRDRLRCSSTGGGFLFMRFSCLIVQDTKNNKADADNSQPPPREFQQDEQPSGTNSQRQRQNGDKGGLRDSGCAVSARLHSVSSAVWISRRFLVLASISARLAYSKHLYLAFLPAQQAYQDNPADYRYANQN